MAKSEKQKLKLLVLLRIFEEKTDEEHRISIGEIIRELEKEGIRAERKSLYDDFQTLREAGYDIQGSKTAEGYTYCMGKRTFELAELKLLVDSVQSAKFITRAKSDELITKLETFCSRYNAGKLQRQVYVSGRVKTGNEEIFGNVDCIHEAIAGNRKITFRYWNWNVKKETEFRKGGARYQVSPWGLLWEDENYYLVAFDDADQKLKHYRVDKMNDILLTEEKREGGDSCRGLDLADYSRKTFGMFGGEEKKVTLLCENRYAGVMIDRFGKEVFMVPKGKDHFSVTVKVALSSQFTAWVMGLSGGVVVTSPKEVKELMQKEAQALLSAYEEKVLD